MSGRLNDLNVKWISVKELKPHPKNPNKHPQDQIERLVKLIKYQGFRVPIIVSNLSGFIVSGHGRLEAALKLGLTTVPVTYQDFDDKEMEFTFLTSDNAIHGWSMLDIAAIEESVKGLGEFDYDLLGLKDFSIDDEEPQGDADSVPEAPKVARSKLGDLWTLGNHRLLCGDSTDIQHVERLMGGEKADLWIADPPFGVSYMEKNAAVHGGIVKNQTGKEIKSDTKTVEELCPFWRDTAVNAYLVTTDEASNYWCACQGSDKMMMMMMMMMDEAGWNIRHELIWVKSSFVFGRSDYHYRHEPIIYGWKKKGTHNWYGDRKQDSVLEIDRPSKSDLHPTTKPVELFSKFISNSTKPGDKILESFGGSGTTLIASETLKRKSYTMEMDPKYVDVILQRWADYTGKDPVREDGVKWSELASEQPE